MRVCTCAYVTASPSPPRFASCQVWTIHHVFSNNAIRCVECRSTVAVQTHHSALHPPMNPPITSPPPINRWWWRPPTTLATLEMKLLPGICLLPVLGLWAKITMPYASTITYCRYFPSTTSSWSTERRIAENRLHFHSERGYLSPSSIVGGGAGWRLCCWGRCPWRYILGWRFS